MSEDPDLTISASAPSGTEQNRPMTFSLRAFCKYAATLLGAVSAILGFWSSQIEVPQIRETLASGYVTGAVEIYAALKRQGDLGAWAAVAAALAAIAAAFS